MKKSLLSFAVLAMGMSLLTACSDDDSSTPEKKAVNYAAGMYLVGSGNMSSNIDGNLTYINYLDSTATPNAFQAVNGKSLGKTANHVMVYGSKLYIVVDGENTIWVCDKQTLKVQQQLSTVALLGETNGFSPRCIASYGGKVFFTCYGESKNGGNGLVASVDTVGFQLQKQYSVGSYPNGLTVCNDQLFVANSDYGNGEKPSVSVINLKSDAVKEVKDEAITNPMEMLTLGDAAYFVDYGTYDEMWNQVGAGVRRVDADGKVTKVVNATAFGTDGKRLFAIDAPYGSNGTTYYIYDPAIKQTTTWTPEGVDFPAVIAGDPMTGHIFVVGYQPNPDYPVYAAYNLPSYVNEYDATGALVKKYENTATGPIAIAFNTSVKYE